MKYAVAGALAAMLVCSAAEAQINPFRSRSAATLNGADIAMLLQASNALLARPMLSPGEAETWRNPQSGSAGSITVSSATKRRGMGCYVLDYDSQASGAQAGRTGSLVWCKAPQGWRIAS